jgi:putative transposase
VSDKFALIAAERSGNHRDVPAVTSMCQTLSVTRSIFDDGARAEPSARAVRRAKIAVHLKAAFRLGRGTCGVRRVHAVLTRSEDPEATTGQDEDRTPAIVDHVGRDFTATTPGTRLVCDIIYIRT